MPITLTLKRAAEESGLSQRTIQYAIADGRLPSTVVAGRRLIRTCDLEEFLLGDEHRDWHPTSVAKRNKERQPQPASDSVKAGAHKPRRGQETKMGEVRQ
jgi:excisionase family DNA binding protein